MLLADLFKKLARNELKNLALAKSGDISAAEQPSTVDYLNEGLLRLFTRFVLKENDVMLELHEHVTFYHLLPRFASNYVHIPGADVEDEPIRYIIDTPGEPFNDEFLKVLTVFDSWGREIPLNDSEKHNSVFTPQTKLLQVPNPIYGKFLSVKYQQRHSEIHGKLDEEINCPDILLGALTAYIGYKTFSHMNSGDSNKKSQEFNATYETVCNEVVDRDLVNSSISQSNVRFHRGGWI